MILRRANVIHRLSLIPTEWSGRGLLGYVYIYRISLATEVCFTEIMSVLSQFRLFSPMVQVSANMVLQRNVIK